MKKVVISFDGLPSLQRTSWSTQLVNYGEFFQQEAHCLEFVPIVANLPCKSQHYMVQFFKACCHILF